MSDESSVDVYLDEGGNGAVRVGTLRPSFQGGRALAGASFEYDAQYLVRGDRYEISPELPLVSGRTYTAENQVIFGAFADASPDEWGQRLIQANHAVRLRADPSLPRRIGDFDYLLGVSDFARMGALRFSRAPESKWLSSDRGVANLHDLGRIVGAAQRYEEQRATDEDVEYLNGLATSPGGARPKANVLTDDGRLAIAKLPHSKDGALDVEAWEAVALTIAKRSRIPVAPFRAVRAGDDRTVLLVERFDRGAPEVRHGYISAATALGIGKHDTGVRVTYEQFADTIVETSGQPVADLHDMFRRIALTVLINNVDDHWGNHGFLRAPDGWRLSPVFDVNPRPRFGDINSRPISDEDDPRHRDISNLFEIADRFNLTATQAAESLRAVSDEVDRWPEIAESLNIPRNQQSLMAPAFDQDQRERVHRISEDVKHAAVIPLAASSSAQADRSWVPPHMQRGRHIAGYWRTNRR